MCCRARTTWRSSPSWARVRSLGRCSCRTSLVGRCSRCAAMQAPTIPCSQAQARPAHRARGERDGEADGVECRRQCGNLPALAATCAWFAGTSLTRSTSPAGQLSIECPSRRQSRNATVARVNTTCVAPTAMGSPAIDQKRSAHGPRFGNRYCGALSHAEVAQKKMADHVAANVVVADVAKKDRVADDVATTSSLSSAVWLNSKGAGNPLTILRCSTMFQLEHRLEHC